MLRSLPVVFNDRCKSHILYSIDLRASLHALLNWKYGLSTNNYVKTLQLDLITISHEIMERKFKNDQLKTSTIISAKPGNYSVNDFRQLIVDRVKSTGYDSKVIMLNYLVGDLFLRNNKRTFNTKSVEVARMIP